MLVQVLKSLKVWFSGIPCFSLHNPWEVVESVDPIESLLRGFLGLVRAFAGGGCAIDISLLSFLVPYPQKSKRRILSSLP
jgi:hypothetical protein